MAQALTLEAHHRLLQPDQNGNFHVERTVCDCQDTIETTVGLSHWCRVSLRRIIKIAYLLVKVCWSFMFTLTVISWCGDKCSHIKRYMAVCRHICVQIHLSPVCWDDAVCALLTVCGWLSSQPPVDNRWPRVCGGRCPRLQQATGLFLVTSLQNSWRSTHLCKPRTCWILLPFLLSIVRDFMHWASLHDRDFAPRFELRRCIFGKFDIKTCWYFIVWCNQWQTVNYVGDRQ
jgi:hypothetical protein